MRPNSNFKRNRNRNQSRRNGNGSPNKSNNFDSSGPDTRVRGNAIQVNEKYLALANDASTSGDRIKAEGFFQHAEHYYRVFMLANGGIDPRKIPAEESIAKEADINGSKDRKKDENQKITSEDTKNDNDINNVEKDNTNNEDDEAVPTINQGSI